MQVNEESGVAKRKWDRTLTGIVLLWTFLACCFPLYDTDFWWHLRTGELILERGELPQVDWFTYTDFDKPWIDLHWGFQLFITGLYRLGGVNLVILVKAAIITCAVTIAWHAKSVPDASSVGDNEVLPTWTKALLWLPPIVAITGRGYERPEMLSLLFLACWLWIAARVEQRPRLIWLLPPLQLVWTNCHALFVLGLIVGVCYAIDRSAHAIIQRRRGLASSRNQPDARTIIRVGALVAVACFINPYFEEGALFPLTLYRKFNVDQEFYSKYIGEFQKPISFLMAGGWTGILSRLTNIYLLAELLTWLSTAGSFIVLAFRGRCNVGRLLLFAAFSHLAWEASRNTNIFSLVSGVILTANCVELAALSHCSFSPRVKVRLNQTMCFVAVGLIVAVVTGQWNRWGEGIKPFRLGEAEAWFIHDAAKFAGQPGFPDRAFVANNGQAAVYSYHNGPEKRIFMDGRLEVCTRETFEQYNLILELMARGDPGWQAFVQGDRPGLPAVILDSRSSRSQINGLLNTPGWRLVFADPTAAVFVNERLAEKLNLPAANLQPLLHPPGMTPRREELKR